MRIYYFALSDRATAETGRRVGNRTIVPARPTADQVRLLALRPTLSERFAFVDADLIWFEPIIGPVRSILRAISENLATDCHPGESASPNGEHWVLNAPWTRRGQGPPR
jgi:hypothetical protein